jgi:hypothetical protein
MTKVKQRLLPNFTMERVIIRKIVPHTRHGVVLRFRTQTRVGYRVRWNQSAEEALPQGKDEGQE